MRKGHRSPKCRKIRDDLNSEESVRSNVDQHVATLYQRPHDVGRAHIRLTADVPLLLCRVPSVVRRSQLADKSTP